MNPGREDARSESAGASVRSGPDGPGSDGSGIDTAVELLTGDGAAGPLAAAMSAAGAELGSWQRSQVTYRPDRGVTVSYRTQVSWPDGGGTTETLVACAGDIPDGALVVEDGACRVGVWRVPFDPALPGYPAACDEATVAALLAGMGAGSGPVRLRPLAYRPGRRAVVEASGPWGRLYLKVVRPDRAEALHQRHRTLVAAGVPAPASVGWSRDGIVVLEALPGRTLRDGIRDGAALPPGADLLDLLDRLPADLADGPVRRSWAAVAPYYGRVVGEVVPGLATQAADLAAELVARASSPALPGPVHGDFYENQIMVEQGVVCGLLDVDGAGPGDRADDLACLVGHLSVLTGHLRGAAAVRAREALHMYLAGFEQRVPPAILRPRAAAVVLSLTTGPYRVQEPGWEGATRTRLDLAAAWLAGADGPAGVVPAGA